MEGPASDELHVPGYEIGRVIGRGGFGVVFEAHDRTFNRRVAIKVLPSPVDPAANERFDRERLTMGTVSGHPNIVDVYASGYDGRGRPYLVMKYMRGGSLGHRVKRHGALAWQEVTAIGIKLAGALETAHRSGVLHRDIKPDNVLVSQYGEPQLADFGISRLEAGGSPTAVSVPAFTPLYAAPEVMSGQLSSRGSDIYSLGATLYELLAGRAAFESDDDEDVLALMYRIATEPVPDLRPRGVPDEVCRPLERAMAKEPAFRQDSAASCGLELRRAQQALGSSTTMMPLMVGTSVASEPEAPSRRFDGERPGAGLASRPLHVIWIVDCSASMRADGKIEAVNIGLREAVDGIRQVANDHPYVRVFVRCLAFSSEVRWALATPTPLDEVLPIELRAGGLTNLGAALTEVAHQLRVPPMDPRSLPPALVLISDGRASDDFEAGLGNLLAEPWGAKAVRAAVAIGDFDHQTLARFIGRPGIEPFEAGDAAQLRHLIRWASTSAARLASMPADNQTQL
jgi:uncharacterized protein YegL